MPSIINATTTNGLVTSADNSGSLQLQTNSGTTAVTIDTSQNVGIGTSSPARNLSVVNSSAPHLQLALSSDQASGNGFELAFDGSANYIAGRENVPTIFSTNNTERMRIDSSGRVGINTAPAGYIGNEQFMVAGTNTAGQHTATITQAASSPSGGCNLFLVYNNSAPNNTSNSFLICNDNTGVQKLNIYSNGTVSNRTGTYNTLSDAKIKENIVDATPKLDKLMQAKVRNYNLIGDDLKQIGFVAQELEQVFPSLVEDVPDYDENQQPTGEVTKMVKTSVLIPILVKAIQELKAELDATKAEVQALKGVA